MNPPLRVRAIGRPCSRPWATGTIDYLATDHAPHTLVEKDAGVSGQPHLDTLGRSPSGLLVAVD